MPILLEKTEVSNIKSRFIWTTQMKNDILEHIAALEAMIPAETLMNAVAGDARARQERALEREAKFQQDEAARAAARARS